MNKALIPLLCTATALTLRAVELYSSDFSTFTPGSGKLTSPNDWALSSTHSTYTWLHGIDAESTHAVLGLGNAAYFGGNGQSMTFASVGNAHRFPFVQRTYSHDPVTTNTEIVTIAMLAGVLDSSTTVPMRRDDFEIYVSNISAEILAAIQFDNSSVVTGATGGECPPPFLEHHRERIPVHRHRRGLHPRAHAQPRHADQLPHEPLVRLAG